MKYDQSVGLYFDNDKRLEHMSVDYIAGFSRQITKLPVMEFDGDKVTKYNYPEENETVLAPREN